MEVVDKEQRIRDLRAEWKRLTEELRSIEELPDDWISDSTVDQMVWIDRRILEIQLEIKGLKSLV